jgi:hypothetical protein
MLFYCGNTGVITELSPGCSGCSQVVISGCAEQSKEDGQRLGRNERKEFAGNAALV